MSGTVTIQQCESVMLRIQRIITAAKDKQTTDDTPALETLEIVLQDLGLTIINP